MSLWGKKDIYSFGANISVTNGNATVTTAGSFVAGGNNEIYAGDLIRISGVDYRVANVASATSLTLTTVYAGSTATVLAANAFRRPIPKYWLAEFDSAPDTIYFVDATESSLDENKSRGLNSPGWWRYFEYTTEAGDTRYKTECLVTIVAPLAGDDDLDDPDVADVASAVTITVQPANSTSSAGAGSFTLTTTTTGTPGSLVYKWQRQTANGTTWKDITASVDSGITYADFNAATLTYSGLLNGTKNGFKYRVKITSAGGTEEVISNGAATLTFGT